MNDKQKYYEYDPSQGGAWWKKDIPSGKEEFQAKLTRLAGLNEFGDPVLRVEWAGTLMHDITEVPQLKYKATVNAITKHRYISTDGRQKVWHVGEKAPTDIDRDEPIVGVKEPIAIGRLRWVIEHHESAESLRSKGRFTNLHDDQGVKVLRDLPPEGVYNHYFWVRTRDYKYRDLDPQVFTAIEAIWHYDISTSEAQKALDAIEIEANQTIIGAQEASSIWASMGQ